MKGTGLCLWVQHLLKTSLHWLHSNILAFLQGRKFFSWSWVTSACLSLQMRAWNTLLHRSTLRGLLRVWLWRSSSCCSGGWKERDWNCSDSNFYSGLPFGWHLQHEASLQAYEACTIQREDTVWLSPWWAQLENLQKNTKLWCSNDHFCHSLLFLKSVLSLLRWSALWAPSASQ